jgi:hypothetical protein
MRGFGRVFKPGSIYWIAYNHRGKEHRESAKTENESAARKLLKKRIGEVTSGKLIGPSEERLSFENMADALVTDYEINKLRSLRSVKLSVRHLRRTFALDRAVDFTTDRIKKYIRSEELVGHSQASPLAAPLHGIGVSTDVGGAELHACQRLQNVHRNRRQLKLRK